MTKNESLACDQVEYGIGVERDGDLVLLVVHVQLGQHDPVATRVPVAPPLARKLASALLGAAKAADPEGHVVMMDSMAKEIVGAFAMSVPIPGGARH